MSFVLSNNTLQHGFLALILVFVAFFSLYKLTESPPVWYDEGFYHQAAINWLVHGEQGLQVEPGVFASASNSTVGFPLIYPLKVSFGAFGIGVPQTRAVMVIFMLLLVFFSYQLLYRLYGFKMAVWGTALLATFPVFYGNGKSVLGEVPGMFFVVLCLLFVHFFERSNCRDVRMAALAGLAGGLATATKPIFLLLLPAVLIPLILFRKRVTFESAPIIAGVVGFLVPIALWVLTQFNDSDSFLQILKLYATPSGVEDTWGLIVENVMRFVREMSPVYTLILAVAWSASFIHRKRETSLAEGIAFVFFALVLLAYLRTPGWYRYFFEAQVLGLLFLPFALSVIKWTRPFQTVIVVLFLMLNVYQLGFHSFVAESYQSTRTAELEAYFGSYPLDVSFFVYNVPEVVIFLPSRNYYQYIEPRETQLIGEEELPKIKQGIPDEIILQTSTYEEKKREFELYGVKDTISRYTILKRL